MGQAAGKQLVCGRQEACEGLLETEHVKTESCARLPIADDLFIDKSARVLWPPEAACRYSGLLKRWKPPPLPGRCRKPSMEAPSPSFRLGSNGHLPGHAAALEAEGAIEALTASAWAGTLRSEPGRGQGG